MHLSWIGGLGEDLFIGLVSFHQVDQPKFLYGFSFNQRYEEEKFEGN
jgi:hypothetical protein